MHRTANAISAELHLRADDRKAAVLAGFFKTGKGEYGEGDVFYGVKVPQTRAVAARHAKDATLGDVASLLDSRVHEERLAALLILVDKFAHAKEAERREIFDFYLRNSRKANNWDLVDLSADKIVGAFLQGKDKAVLRKLARSQNLWQRRIAMVATFHEIRRGNAKPALEIAGMLLRDEHDLIQKAAGWMLREVGKRCSQAKLEAFLEKHAAKMPRTMLRYAIERLPASRKRYYLGKKQG